jgi:Protein of unknown function (DUF4089)
MARARKSRPKAKAASAKPRRAKPTPKRPKAGRKATSSKSVVTAPALHPLDGFIEAAARVLALPLEPQWLPDINANLAVTLRAAALVADFALPDESEPAPIFRA